MKTEVLIVGGGPAGSSAGIHLLQDGFSDVTIIDKSKFPRNKLCGGLVTHDATPELKAMGIQYKNNPIFHKNTYVRYYNRKRLINEYTGIKGFVVQRYEFDNLLLNRFKELGGNTIEGSQVIHVEKERNTVVTSDGQEIEYKWLIGADGSESRVRDAINSVRPLNAFCAQVTAPLTFDTKDTTAVVFGKVDAGFEWRFATETDVKCGIGSFDVPKRLVRKLQKEYPELKVEGHFVPYGNLPEVRCKDNIFLVGDAGGYVDPVLGEGISFAINHGAFFPKILRSKNPCETYNSLFASMVRHIKYGKFMRKVFFHPWFHEHALHYFAYAPATTEAITNKIVMEKTIQYYEVPKIIKLALKP